MAKHTINCTVVAREIQYEQLKSVFVKGRLLPSAVLIWGPHSSGKSYTISKVIEDLPNLRHLAQVNAREIICGRRQFLETIIRQLYKVHENKVNLEDINCDHLSTFVRALWNIGNQVTIQSQPMILIIEEAELLREEHGDIIEVLSHIQDMITFNFCVIFLSSLPLSSYSTLLELKNILTIRFPQYTKDELTKIIAARPPPNCNIDLFQYYVTTTINVFYMACRDLRKLQRLTTLNFEEFVRPLADNINVVSQKSLYKVWKTIEPKLTQDFKTLQSNIVPASSYENETIEEIKLSKQKTLCQLPVHAKYLLVAAYIASYNPPSSDRRFFVKSQLAKKRRIVKNPVERKDPQIFTQARFFAIYSALTDSSPEFGTALMNQITHLCDMKLLSLISSSTTGFDDPKYKCLASFPYIKDVALSVDVDIKNYLYHLI